MKFKLFSLAFCLCHLSVSGYPQSPAQKNQNETEPVQFQLPQNQNKRSGDEICLENKQTGPCKASIPKYYFNQGTRQCELFIYGGCDGSNNRFDSFGQCEDKCSNYLRKDEPMTINNNNDNEANPDIICEMPHSEGESCKAYVPRWTFNSSLGKCVQFIYQGCGATKNNFRNKYVCEKTCGNYKKASSSSSESGNLKKIGTNAACKLPMDSGSCYGLTERYYFNTVNNRCEQFVFGGCGGNENNFKNVQDCLRTCGGDEPSHDSSCVNVECPWSRYTHYTTMGCKPIYDSNACCPTRFDCPDANLTSTEPKCRYQGQFYLIGETINDASSLKDCRASCACTLLGGKPKIQCASIECPEHLGAVPPGKESCRRLYKRGSCCADSYYCPNEPRTVDESQKGVPPPPPVEPYECHFEGKTYYEGERMYPQKSKCLTCSCQKGFNGTLTEEFCDKVDCGIEIYYSDQLERGCAPVYFQNSEGIDSYCPINWQCPDEQQMTTLPVLTKIPRPTQNIPSSQGPITILPVPVPDTTSDRLTSAVCQLPKETGPCKAIRPRFYFNSQTKKCEAFTYGGCAGNKNNFVAQADCERICEANANNQVQDEKVENTKSLLTRVGSVQIQPPTSYKLTETDPCEQPVKTGPCRAYLPRYFFSPQENTCKFFVYGGCRGNENNFYSKTSCEALCQNILPDDSLRSVQNFQIPSTSTIPSEINVDASRVNFEDSQQQQHPGQSPNFKVIDVTPKNICSLRPETGRCKGYIRRYHFDGTICQLFTYGGCGGNANNFEDFEECNRKCSINNELNSFQRSRPKWRSGPAVQLPHHSEVEPTKPTLFSGTERCRLPAKTGSCYAMIPSYYYDVVSRSCQNFTYGGCFGNTNRFVTIEECKATCETPLELERSTDGLILSRGGQAHILPVGEPQNEEDDQVEEDRRQLMPGEVIIEQSPAGSSNRPETVRQIPNTSNEPFEEKVFCSLPSDKGPCKSNELRYFWDSNTKSCLPFYYGGCRGNKNNFLSESDCLTICGETPTIEYISHEGVLSCSFGNETLSLGSTLGASTSRMINNQNNQNNNNNEDEENEAPCGVPICTCQTPPSLTCIQRACVVQQETPHILPIPNIDTTTTDNNSSRSPQVSNNNSNNKIQPIGCPVPDCLPHCTRGIRPDNGCPTCDCDPNKNQDGFEVEHVTISTSTSSGEGVKG